MKKRTVAILLAIVLVFGAAVGGTLAWLMSKPDPVVNTFTSGDVAITLTETWNTESDSTHDGLDSWSAQLVPGKSYDKDPVVTVLGQDNDGDKETNVACYLFVKFEEINNPKASLSYTSLLDSKNGWTKLTDVANGAVWYRTVEVSDEDQSWNLLKGDAEHTNGCVKVLDTLTKTTMPTGNNLPSLKYTAYAIQKHGFDDPADAWAEVSKPAGN